MSTRTRTWFEQAVIKQCKWTLGMGYNWMICVITMQPQRPEIVCVFRINSCLRWLHIISVCLFAKFFFQNLCPDPSRYTSRRESSQGPLTSAVLCCCNGNDYCNNDDQLLSLQRISIEDQTKMKRNYVSTLQSTVVPKQPHVCPYYTSMFQF
jgi:hypothetical protein